MTRALIAKARLNVAKTVGRASPWLAHRLNLMSLPGPIWTQRQAITAVFPIPGMGHIHHPCESNRILGYLATVRSELLHGKSFFAAGASGYVIPECHRPTNVGKIFLDSCCACCLRCRRPSRGRRQETARRAGLNERDDLVLDKPSQLPLTHRQIRGSQPALFLPMGARTKLMIFLGREKG